MSDEYGSAVYSRFQDAGANADGNLASLCSASLGQTRTDLAGSLVFIWSCFRNHEILRESSYLTGVITRRPVGLV